MKRGFRHTEETKKKISENHSHCWLDKKHSLESIEKMRQARLRNPTGTLGKKYSEESKAKMRANHKGTRGIKWSEEYKRKKSEIAKQKGYGLWMIGKTATDVTRRKISERHKGKKHWNWQGGKSDLSLRIRRSFEYRLWRSDIFRRDDFTCQICKIRGGLLHIDHYPKSFAEVVFENKITSLEEALNCEILWDINNGRTLCVSCHKNTDNYLKKFNQKTEVLFYP